MLVTWGIASMGRHITGAEGSIPEIGLPESLVGRAAFREARARLAVRARACVDVAGAFQVRIAAVRGFPGYGGHCLGSMPAGAFGSPIPRRWIVSKASRPHVLRTAL